MGGGGESSDWVRPLSETGLGEKLLVREKKKNAPLSKPLHSIFHGDSVGAQQHPLTWIVLDRRLTAIASSLRSTFRNKQSRAPQAGNSSPPVMRGQLARSSHSTLS